MQLVGGQDGSPFGRDPGERFVAFVYAVVVAGVSVGLVISLARVTGEGCDIGSSGAATVRAIVALIAGAGQLPAWLWHRRRRSGASATVLYGCAALFWVLAFWVYLVTDCR